MARTMEFPASRPLSIIATGVLIGAVVALYATGGLFSLSPGVIVVQIAACFLSVWARVTLGVRSFHYAADPTPGRLVTAGPYRFVRNPIYTAVWLLTWAGMAVRLVPATAALGLLILAALGVRIHCEERLLRDRFPEYPAYARNTARLIPFIL